MVFSICVASLQAGEKATIPFYLKANQAGKYNLKFALRYHSSSDKHVKEMPWRSWTMVFPLQVQPAVNFSTTISPDYQQPKCFRLALIVQHSQSMILEARSRGAMCRASDISKTDACIRLRLREIAIVSKKWQIEPLPGSDPNNESVEISQNGTLSLCYLIRPKQETKESSDECQSCVSWTDVQYPRGSAEDYCFNDVTPMQWMALDSHPRLSILQKEHDINREDVKVSFFPSHFLLSPFSFHHFDILSNKKRKDEKKNCTKP